VPAPSAAPLRLDEPPHTHIVCRNCGRIAAVDLQDAERELLVALASRRPDDWSVDGVAFSITGRCPACRRAFGP
jgi:Fe2+ or Zn2+ uptake regulation protein